MEFENYNLPLLLSSIPNADGDSWYLDSFEFVRFKIAKTSFVKLPTPKGMKIDAAMTSGYWNQIIQYHVGHLYIMSHLL